ncbi:hypothetical protein B0T20DRAFT_427424 [Sordaria brevicollis]|uniref:Uncharacterized protein n=1 Tax=Sordaria brevicollis TaxID=83679 RepID=A0AAE0NRW9_SORBR|nr:hypothetical protein B0T20DRAFT_427424 [Sordaria brevicollis]
MNHHSTTINMHPQNPNETFGEHPASGPAPTTAGHHKHDILNKLDPRVDSTMDHQPIATMAASGEGAFSHGPHEPSHHSTTGMGPSMHGAADPSSSHHIGSGSNYDSTCYNTNNRTRMDDPNADFPVPPKEHHKHRAGFHHGVDVATNSSTITAAGQGHGRLDGVGHTPGNAAGHQKMMGSPTSTSAPLPGPAPNTAGPHRSDLMNKLDPRVDSHGGHWEKY